MFWTLLGDTRKSVHLPKQFDLVHQTSPCERVGSGTRLKDIRGQCVPPWMLTTLNAYHLECLPPSMRTTLNVYHPHEVYQGSMRTTLNAYHLECLPPSMHTILNAYHPQCVPPSWSISTPPWMLGQLERVGSGDKTKGSMHLNAYHPHEVYHERPTKEVER